MPDFSDQWRTPAMALMRSLKAINGSFCISVAVLL
jgi:hypothetical protein